MTEHVYRATLVNLRRQALDEVSFRHSGIATVSLDEPGPLVRLGRSNEGEQLCGVEPVDRVKVRATGAHLADPVATLLDEVIGDGILEELLVGFHAATPGMSISPMTAAVMRA